MIRPGSVIVLIALAVGLCFGQSGPSKTMSSAQIDALWDIDDPAAGYKALSTALQQHPGSADEIHTQIARTLGLQGRFQQGWAELDKVSSNPATLIKVRVQLESGRLKNSSGDKPAAKPYFLEALKMAQQDRDDYYAVDAAHMLGIVTNGQESLDWNEKAIALAKKSKDKRAQAWQGSLLNNTGWTYHDMGKYPEALAKFEAALAFQQKNGNAKQIRLARWAVARCDRSLQRYEPALEILRDLVKYPEAGYASEELGEDLLALGKLDEARPHFKRAYELLSQDPDLKAHEPKRLERLQKLAGL